MRAWASILLAAAAALAGAQIPSLVVHLDVTGSLSGEPDSPTLFQFYDIMGRPSIASLQFYTPQEFRIYVAEKIEPIPGDAPGDPFDQYYIEDEGIWRVGKQYLPFGSGKILHESAIAAQGETDLISHNIPVSLAICDSGLNLESGVVGRVGSLIGVSFAVGRHFGIAGTSLDDIRHPEDAPGEGRGWRDVFGADATRRFGKWTFRAEALTLQQAETSQDEDTTVLEGAGTYQFKPGYSAGFSVTQSSPAQQYFYRASGEFKIVRGLTFEPSIRFRNGELYDVAAQLRIRF